MATVLAPRRADKVLIKLGYDCNNNCTFCHTHDLIPLGATPTAGVRAKLDAAARQGYTMAVFSGGEATMRTDLAALLEHTRSVGMASGIISNGRMFAYRPFAEKLERRGLLYAYISLHGPDAKVHDPIVRAKAFHETLAGIRNLTALRVPVVVNTVVVKQNLGHLRGMIDLLAPIGVRGIKFSATEPKGSAIPAFDHIIPTITATAAAVADALAYARARYGRTEFLTGFENIPFCLSGLDPADHDDLFDHGYHLMSEADEDAFYLVDDRNKIRPPETCIGCPQAVRCPGLFTGYYERLGAAELRPPERFVANSFVFLPGGAAVADAGGCLCAGPGSPDSGRSQRLWIAADGRAQPYITNTGDFDAVAIAATVRALGQVYDSPANTVISHDFRRDYRKLDACERACPEPACLGVFTPGDAGIFARDDAAIAAAMASLRGHVVDAGCGEGFYAGTLRALLEAAAITYLGIDPEAVRSPLGAGARYIAGEFEAVEPEPQAADAVLMLRSWNHFRDPFAAAARAVAWLKPGGKLLVTDNCAFAVCLGAGTAVPPVSAAHRREHRRNHDSHLAAAVLRHLPLRVLSHTPIARDRSNAWVLILERTEAAPRRASMPLPVWQPPA